MLRKLRRVIGGVCDVRNTSYRLFATASSLNRWKSRRGEMRTRVSHMTDKISEKLFVLFAKKTDSCYCYPSSCEDQTCVMGINLLLARRKQPYLYLALKIT